MTSSGTFFHVSPLQVVPLVATAAFADAELRLENVAVLATTVPPDAKPFFSGRIELLRRELIPHLLGVLRVFGLPPGMCHRTDDDARDDDGNEARCRRFPRLPPLFQS
jgi:hypothetical protein